MHKVYLKPGKEDTLKRFHPWIFSGAIARFDGEPDEGEVVEVYTSKKEFIAEGLNEAGLSAGLFYFPHYGKYPEYDQKQNSRTLSDLQFVSWILSNFSTIDEVKKAIEQVRIVSLDKEGASSTVH